MPSDDYGYVAGGGLKLKGSKISKSRKKKSSGKTQKRRITDTDNDSTNHERISTSVNEKEISPTSSINSGNDNKQSLTPSERKFLEIQKVRLEKRLKEEGVKSHEQLVEEYNTYLSRLSEHHDMPKIGPG